MEVLDTNQYMKLTFPDDFLWGTSSAAAQIETASDHNWKGVPSMDGYVFDRTTDHEKRRMEDVEYITQFGSIYRCGVDWARLQTAPFADFETDVVKEYQDFFEELNNRGMKIMFVMHHFTNPLWFENNGTWENEKNIDAFVDYGTKCIEHFSDYVYNWNTFNEPNVYAINGWLTGNFPPFKKSLSKADKVIKNLAAAHDIMYAILQVKTPSKPVGISLNTIWFEAKNVLGIAPAQFANWWFHKKVADLFQDLDFWGISYYANILLDPTPITYIETPEKVEKLGLPHDKMWIYKPEGLRRYIKKIYDWHPKPIIITENGICTEDSQVRINSIKDYLTICHELIAEGIPLQGYIHWSTWDNFEWNLGPTYRFGLVSIDLETMERSMTEAGEFYKKITETNELEL